MTEPNASMAEPVSLANIEVVPAAANNKLPGEESAPAESDSKDADASRAAREFRRAVVPVASIIAGDIRPVAVAGNSLPAVVPLSDPDLGSLVRDVEGILEAADRDQAALTERYIEAGRRLWQIRKRCKHGDFGPLLERSFPSRKSRTLREYMTLAKAFDAAEPATKVQLTGLFKDGWGAVLGQIRTLKRAKKIQATNGQPIQVDTAINDNLTILLGDCMAKLRELPTASVDCVITSPPYYRRHQFPGANTVFGGDPGCIHDWQMGPSGQSSRCRTCNAQSIALGWEANIAEYVQHMVEVSKELRRVLKPTGVVWLNLGDTFLNKHLLLVPARVSTAIADNGDLICRHEVIWHVTNRPPENVIDRPYMNHEHLFMFVARDEYYFNIAAIREPAVTKHRIRFNRHHTPKESASTWFRPVSEELSDGMRSVRSVWSIPTERFNGDHVCPFPKALVERLVLSSCPEGGVCLDPFAGTGTVGLVALALGRRAILIEANAEYCGMAKHRIDTELEPYKAELENHRRRDDNDPPIAVV
jgi:DNA modification methylase